MLNENDIFWSNLEKIQIVLLKTDEDFASFLGLSHHQFLKDRAQKKFLPLLNIFELSEKLNFHFEDLMNPLFNTQNIQSLLYGKQSLDNRYCNATYSFTRPIVNILNYLELARGPRAKINVIRKFQLSEEFISNPAQKTNIFLIADIIRFLASTYNFSEEEFRAMGKRTPFIATNNFLESKLSKHKNITDVLECFFSECSGLFDKNCDYRLSAIMGNQAIIEALPNKYVVDELQIDYDQFGNEQGDMTRMGVFSSITWYKYKSFANIKKISSIYQGDQTNRYIMDISPFQYLSNSNKFLSASSSIYH